MTDNIQALKDRVVDIAGETRDIQALRDRVAAAKEAVVDALRPIPSPLALYRHDDPARLKWEALYEAEHALRAAEEAAKRPRLRTWRETVESVGSNHTYERVIAARDAEWIAAIKGLPQIVVPGKRSWEVAAVPFETMKRDNAILLADILALVPNGPQSPSEPR